MRNILLYLFLALVFSGCIALGGNYSGNVSQPLANTTLAQPSSGQISSCTPHGYVLKQAQHCCPNLFASNSSSGVRCCSAGEVSSSSGCESVSPPMSVCLNTCPDGSIPVDYPTCSCPCAAAGEITNATLPCCPNAGKAKNNGFASFCCAVRECVVEEGCIPEDTLVSETTYAQLVCENGAVTSKPRGCIGYNGTCGAGSLCCQGTSCRSSEFTYGLGQTITLARCCMPTDCFNMSGCIASGQMYENLLCTNTSFSLVPLKVVNYSTSFTDECMLGVRLDFNLDLNLNSALDAENYVLIPDAEVGDVKTYSKRTVLFTIFDFVDPDEPFNILISGVMDAYGHRVPDSSPLVVAIRAPSKIPSHCPDWV